MKTWTITLAASLLLVAVPFVTAEEACARAGITEAVSHPTKADTYIFFDVTKPDKIGEWIERNKSPGLQTVKCFSTTGGIRWGADEKVDILG